MSLADDSVGEQRVQRHEGSAHTEHLYEQGAGEPPFGYGEHDKLACHHAEAQEQGKGDERREAHELAHGGKLPLTVVAQVNKHGLRHLRHHVLDKREALEVPLVCLVIVASVLWCEIMSEHNVEHVVVDVRRDGRCENFAREAEHPFHGSERYAVDGWSAHIDQALRCQRPVGHSCKRHSCSHAARHEHRRH